MWRARGSNSGKTRQSSESFAKGAITQAWRICKNLIFGANMNGWQKPLWKKKKVFYLLGLLIRVYVSAITGQKILDAKSLIINVLI